MPTYCFRAMDGSGEIIERTYSMKDVPDCGRCIDVGGRVFQRIMSPDIQIGGEMGWRRRRKWPVHSNALPRWQRPAKESDSMRTEFDEKGRVVIRDQRHENELRARLGRAKLDVDGE